MSAPRRWLLVAVLLLLGTGAATIAPRGLRRMQSFHVQNVELVGASYLTLPDAIAASGISPTSSLFDDLAPWRAALLRHPLVRDVQITRRIPGTIVLRITETRPLVFARLGELRPVDARGRILTIDPARTPMDLPVLAGQPSTRADVELTDAASLRALRVLERVAALEPELFALTSEAVALSDGVRLVLREPRGAQLLLPEAPDSARLHLLRLALADVSGARSDTVAASELHRVRRIDARFGDQIVVALQQNESR